MLAISLSAGHASFASPPVDSTPASAPASSGPDIYRIEMASNAQGSSLRLELSDLADYRAFALREPARLVIDLPGARLRHIPAISDIGPVGKIRVGKRDGGITRIVLDLRQAAMFRNARLRRSGAGRAELTLDILRVPEVEFQQQALSTTARRTVSAGKRAHPPGATAFSAQHLARSPLPRLKSPAQGAQAAYSAYKLIDEVVARLVAAGRADSAAAGIRPPLRPAMASPAAAPIPASLKSSGREPVRLRSAPIIVALDPGHGGADPGAIRHGVHEKNVVLQFGHLLREVLERDPQFRVFMTRERDVYLRLRERTRLARIAGASLFISLHADTVTVGDAEGATVLTLSEQASDLEAQKLAEVENRADAIAGVDLSEEGDDVAEVLISLAQAKSNKESERLAKSLIAGMRGKIRVLRTRPHRHAGLAVLKSADMPSVLVELGFLTNAQDRRNLTSPEWQARAAEAIASGVRAWVREGHVPPYRDIARLEP